VAVQRLALRRAGVELTDATDKPPAGV